MAFRVASLAAACVLFLGAVPAGAGHGGGGGGHGGGGHHAAAYHGGGYHGGYHGGYGYYHGGYGYHHGGFYGYRPYGWGYPGWGYPGWGYGRFWAYGYRPYPYYGLGLGIGFGYPGYLPYGYGLGYGSGLASGSYYAGPNTVVTPSVPAPATPPPEETPQPQQDGTARLMLLVPANAEVWFDGQPTTQTGTERAFVSPVLTPGKTYTYAVRVRYVKDDGKVSDETRPIQVRANDRWVVDFTRPAPRMPEAPPDGGPEKLNPPPVPKDRP